MKADEKRQTVRVTNIQRFCLHDGPGIRTTVFLKGCSIHCPWCCNPENISYEIQPWRDPDSGESGIYGYDISLKDLEKELLKDRDYYIDGGGVTFSGGEPLLQIRRLESLLRKLKRYDIHLAIETSLFATMNQVEIAARYFNWWYVDMKLLDPDFCQKTLGGDVLQYLNNLLYLSLHGGIPHIRIPCVHGYTDTQENTAYLIQWLHMMNLQEIEIFGIHDLAQDKYSSLNRKCNIDASKSESAVQVVSDSLIKAGIPFHVVQI